MMPWYLHRPEYISIHALVKRATHRHYRADSEGLISIHALVKRATANSIYLIITSSNFNPRPRKEGDSLFIGFNSVNELFQSTPS